MKIVIILPTYNERENILPLLDALQDQFKTIPQATQILVVDDNSPDGTADVVRAEYAKVSNLFLITAKKQGLGAGYTFGECNRRSTN